MIKLVLHKIISLTFIVLVLFSTASLTVEKHFCGDNLIDLSLFSSTEKCGGDVQQSSEDHEVLEKSCCKDVVELISTQNQLDTNSKNDFSQFQKQFAAVFVYTYAGLFEEKASTQNSFLNYNAPRLVYDLNILEQVFLI